MIINLDKPSEYFASFKFGAGEVHFKLLEFDNSSPITLLKRINNSDDLMLLLLAADAIGGNVSAIIPYLPYSRQDRKMVKGEPFSLKVLANILKTANFNKVYTIDPHSNVSELLIENLSKIDLHCAFYNVIKVKLEKQFGEYSLVSPDAGALKKIYDTQKQIGGNDILCANKVRNLNTGEIIRTEVLAAPERIKGQNLIIVDDICSRGGTFKALASVLKEQGAASVTLVVSHYEWTANEEEMQKSGIDKIYTTDSISPDFVMPTYLNLVEVIPVVRNIYSI